MSRTPPTHLHMVRGDRLTVTEARALMKLAAHANDEELLPYEKRAKNKALAKLQRALDGKESQGTRAKRIRDKNPHVFLNWRR